MPSPAGSPPRPPGGGDNRRLFFALWPDAAVREGILELPRRVTHHNGRPVRRENLHLTLVFLGSVGPDKQRCVSAAAARVRGAPFTLTLDRVGFWSGPRILWRGTGRVPRALADLVRDLNAVLAADCGYVPEERPFIPHVTVARKARRNLPVMGVDPVRWEVAEFCLVESVTDPEGVRYQVLERWPLTASPPRPDG